MRRHLMITQPMQGNGDVEGLENMILTAQYNDNLSEYKTQIDVILVYRDLLPERALLRQEQAEEALNKYPFVKIHSNPSIANKAEESGWGGCVGMMLDLMRERVQGRRPEKIKFDTLTVIPNGHRLISLRKDGQPIKTQHFSCMMEQIYLYVDINYLNNRMMLYTEVGRLENNKQFALQTMGLGKAPETFIHISSLNPLVQGAHERYQYIPSADGLPITFEIQVPHFCFQDLENVSVQFPIMSPQKITQLYNYTGTDGINSPAEFEVFCYMPVGSDDDPVNFTHEQLKDALYGARKMAYAYGIQTIRCKHYGIAPIVPANEEQDHANELSGIKIVSEGKVDHTDFLDEMKKSDLAVVSGDWSYIESLLIGVKGLVMYCSRFHKKVLHNFANTPFALNPFVRNAEEVLRPVSPASERDKKKAEIITLLQEVVELAIGYKLSQIPGVGGLHPNLERGVLSYQEVFTPIETVAQKRAYELIETPTPITDGVAALSLITNEDSDEGNASAPGSADREMPGDGGVMVAVDFERAKKPKLNLDSAAVSA